MTFDDAFLKLIQPNREGDTVSLDSEDRGNWTSGRVGVGVLKGSKFGISAAQYPGEDIANLTVERAKQLYRRDYWGPAGCDAVPDTLRFDLFDMAVNSGPKQAARTLQRAVGTVDDGIIGPATLLAVSSMPAARLAARFNGVRLKFLTDLPAWTTQGKGWARRIAANLMET